MTLEIVLGASLLLAIASATTSLMTRASAASRHAIWTAALLSIVAMPAARAFLPAIEVPVLTPASTITTGSTPASAPAIAHVGKSPSVAPAISPDAQAAPAMTADRIASAIWLAGIAALSLWYAAGTIGVWRLSRRSAPAPADVTQRALQHARAAGITRAVRIRIACDERVPLTWGLMRPTVLLPAGWRAWPADRLDAALAHELAHAARFDVLAHRIGRLAAALYWFNPLVWFAMRQAQLERERACDDRVLSQGSIASTYAAELLEFARALAAPAAVLPMARRSRLEARVMAILDPRTNRKRISIGAAMLASALVAGTVTASAIKLTRYDFPPVPQLVTVEAEHMPPPPPPPPYVDLSGTWTAINPGMADLATMYFDKGLSNAPASFTLTQDRQNLAFVRKFKQRDLVSVFPINGFSFQNVLSRVHGTDSGAAHWKDGSLVVGFSRGDFLVFSLKGDQLRVDQTDVQPLLYKRANPQTPAPAPDEPKAVAPPQPAATPQAQTAPAQSPRPAESVRSAQCEAERATAVAQGWDLSDVYLGCEAGAHQPVRVHSVKPQYTPEALRQKIQGSAQVTAVVETDGTVRETRVVNSVDAVFGLDEQARKAVTGSLFRPGTKDGVPVRMLVTFDLEFTVR